MESQDLGSAPHCLAVLCDLLAFPSLTWTLILWTVILTVRVCITIRRL